MYNQLCYLPEKVGIYWHWDKPERKKGKNAS